MNGFLGTGVVLFALLLVLSWPVNVWKLTQCDFEGPYRCEAIHALGLIPVLAPFTVWAGTD